jgi:phospholipid/cholesterol/gamma-HCH transport system substrate-binding protein
VQARLLQSFENYDIAHAPLRADALGSGGMRLVTDLRAFEIAVSPEAGVKIALSAKMIDGEGRLRAARIFEKLAPLDGLTPAKAATAFDHAFGELARDLVGWVASNPGSG